MRYFLCCLVCVLATYVCPAQPLTSRQIDELTERTMKAFDVPGIAVAVIKDGKVIHERGYGVASLQTKRKVDAQTMFGIASNSKAFTAAALGILVDEGRIKWDDKVRQYIPEFTLYDAYATAEFTIRDLLTHRSGLGLGAGDLMLFPDNNDFTLKEVIYNLRYLKPVSSFRSKFDYDNNMYMIAGEIVARVSGMSWDRFVEQRIFAPLGMHQSAGAYDRLQDKRNVIDAHAPVEEKVQVIDRDEMRLGHSAGGIYSNIHELSKWVMMLMNKGRYGKDSNRHIISEAVVREMCTPQTIIRGEGGPYNTHFGAYGLGFFLSDVKGYKQVSHTGGLEGMVTQITMLPELKLAIIVLTNQQEGGAFSAITNQIKDSYLGITGTDRVVQYSKNRREFVSEAKRIMDSVWAITADAKRRNIPVDTTAYTGTYTDKWFGPVVVSARKGKMYIASQRSFKMKGELLYLKGNTFVARWNDRSMDADAFVTFSLDETGKAHSAAMKAISPTTDFSFDFQDLELVRNTPGQ